MAEFRFDYDRNQAVNQGRVVFRMRNTGKIDHQLVLVRLPTGLPGTLDSQLHSPNRLRVETLDIVSAVAPGDAAVFAADLAPGRYGVVCLLRDRDGQSHALKGMNGDVRVS